MNWGLQRLGLKPLQEMDYPPSTEVLSPQGLVSEYSWGSETPPPHTHTHKHRDMRFFYPNYERLKHTLGPKMPLLPLKHGSEHPLLQGPELFVRDVRSLLWEL